MEFDLASSPGLLERLNSMSYQTSLSSESPEPSSPHQKRQTPLLIGSQTEM